MEEAGDSVTISEKEFEKGEEEVKREIVPHGGSGKADEWSDRITDVIRQFVASSKNSLYQDRHEPAFAAPLVGFSRGDDPLYEELKEHVGPFHWTPIEIFSKTFPDGTVKPEELTVISWILPQTKATKQENRRQRRYPSERWARNRLFGENFNVLLRDHVVKELSGRGIKALAPANSAYWEQKLSDRYTFASTWSERHAAYIAGLGTFGLSDGLITEAGKAMRCGSVIANIQVTPSPRPYKDHRAYCLFFSQGTCGKCIERCPAGSVTKEGRDKEKCRDYLRSVTADFVKSHFGIEIYACGLCQTAVPCESRIPVSTTGRLKGLD